MLVVPASTSRLRDLLERIGALLRQDVRLSAGLEPVQVQVLLYLARCNRYSNGPVAVAEFLGTTKGTVSQTIRLLERQGLVQRSTLASDKRRVQLRLSPAGRTLLRQLESPELAAAASALGPDSAHLEALLEQLLRAMQHQSGQRTFGLCHTCRFFQAGAASQYRCGLTGEPLSAADAQRICREHEPLAA